MFRTFSSKLFSYLLLDQPIFAPLFGLVVLPVQDRLLDFRLLEVQQTLDVGLPAHRAAVLFEAVIIRNRVFNDLVLRKVFGINLADLF